MMITNVADRVGVGEHFNPFVTWNGKVSSYILGEFGHLIARRPGCGPKELFNLIHEKLPTVSTSTVSILLSTYAKILMHSHPPDPELQNQVWSTFKKKGEALMDILAEMPKFPERVCINKKVEDTEVDTAEQSAIKLRAQQQSQTSNALVVQDPCPANGTPPLPVGQLGLVKMPSMSVMWMIIQQIQDYHRKMGALATVNSQPTPADNLSDLLGPLAIEGPPVGSNNVHPQPSTTSGLEGTVVEATAIVPAGCRPIRCRLALRQNGSSSWAYGSFLGKQEYCSTCLCSSYHVASHPIQDGAITSTGTIPPCAQVQCPLEVINLRSSRDVAVLDLSYEFGNDMVNVKLRLPAVLNKFLQPISIAAKEFSHNGDHFLDTTFEASRSGSKSKQSSCEHNILLGKYTGHALSSW
ncbi:hypothetical protein PIB30_051587 [Stylosanthes scabra]|uniref:Uncharacterized protein n=1 Tax=Stylosanthes scabra TaxID=79078 RepID=A0ABU6VJX6_9FABA|nr:hypothetical protein [Stylosanthes scabra]